MTLTRRRPFIDIVFLMVLVLALKAGGALAAADEAQRPLGTSQRVVTDTLSGHALDGFDPVAYFDRDAALPGLAAHETVVDGVAWRFAGAANKTAFLADPAAYAPRLGGHDAAAVARGRLVEADPRVFAVVDGRLYVFRTGESRRRFLAENLGPRAEEVWLRLADQWAGQVPGGTANRDMSARSPHATNGPLAKSGESRP